MGRSARRIALLILFGLIASRSWMGHVDISSPRSSSRLDEPLAVLNPSPREVIELASSATRILPALMYVGHPKGDSGTAFVVSKKHRLLVTNAHVAEIMNEVGAMVAIPNGTHQVYQVEKVFFHPGYAGAIREGVAFRKGDRWLKLRDELAPDLAILKLAPDGPDLESECILAHPDEYADLILQPVGLLGFSGPWPEASGPMEAVFKTGQ